MSIDWSKVITAENKAAEEQARRKTALHAERARRLATGTTLVLSFGAVPVQGRPFDQSVMLGLAQRAAALQAAADTEARLTYRDAQNRILKLTAAETLELSAAFMAWVEAVMVASWAQVDAGEIREDYADDRRWPG